jgi:hypothetical protein
LQSFGCEPTAGELRQQFIRIEQANAMKFLPGPIQGTNLPESLDHPDQCAGWLMFSGFGQHGPVGAGSPEPPRERWLAGFDYIEDQDPAGRQGRG